MNAFMAILGESIRLLRARKLFWISLGISALVALLYLSTGFTDKGVSFLFGAKEFEMPMLAKGTPEAEFFYTEVFTTYIVGAWLTWMSLILALISCAPIFPEFMLEGAAGVTLSKPVSRVALFLYKFLGGLLFVMLQTILFTVIVFFAIRWRLGYFLPTIFWAIPLVTLVFSYLFSIQTLIGVKTRSVMFSILGTILIWLMFFCLNGLEAFTYQYAEIGKNPLNMGRISSEEKANWKTYDHAVRTVRMLLPKTSQTSGILNQVIVLRDGDSILEHQIKSGGVREDQIKFAARDSPAYIIWTSIASEVVILGLAAWIFSRRDF